MGRWWDIIIITQMKHSDWKTTFLLKWLLFRIAHFQLYIRRVKKKQTQMKGNWPRFVDGISINLQDRTTSHSLHAETEKSFLLLRHWHTSWCCMKWLERFVGRVWIWNLYLYYSVDVVDVVAAIVVSCAIPPSQKKMEHVQVETAHFRCLLQK